MEYDICGTDNAVILRDTNGAAPSLLVIENEVAFMHNLINKKVLSRLVYLASTFAVSDDPAIEENRQ